MKERTPYTYLIGWSKLNRWYYGRRSREGCHPSEFWHRYFTSSDVVEVYRKRYGEPDVIEIRKIFETECGITQALKCRKWEITVLRRLGVKGSKIWLNRCDSSFDTTGYVSVRNPETGQTYLTEIDDPDYVSGKVVHVATGSSTGIMMAIDSAGDIFRISVDDPRRHSGELKGVNAGKSNYIVDGKVIQLPTDHPDVISGKYQSWSKDTVSARCSITGQSIGRIPCDDPRIQTGEVLLANKGIPRTCSKLKCRFCDREIGSNNHKRHEDYCSENPLAIPNPRIGEKHKVTKKSCQYCRESFTSSGLDRHECKCVLNPNRQLTYHEKMKLFKIEKVKEK